MNRITRLNVVSLSRIVIFTILLSFSNAVMAHGEHGSHHTPEPEEASLDIVQMIMHHISDTHDWHLWGQGDASVSIPLPIILYGSKGSAFFLSSSFHHDDTGRYVLNKNGMRFVKYHEKIYELTYGSSLKMGADGHTPTNAVMPLDLSITKNVASIFLSIVLLILIFRSVAKSYKSLQMPKNKLTGIFEPIIIFIRDEIAKALIGEKKYLKFTPYLLTLFFFIFFNNLLGLIPSGANVTGNIAATMVLALFTLIKVNISGNKNYWKHIFWMPGVPTPIKVFLAPIEVIGIFTKPFALMIRLFANITAGHIIILGLFSVIFVFGWAGSPSILLTSCLMILELVVAFMQAYIFTFLTALFIGSAVEESHH